jgi:hypothetical protein
MHRQGPRGSPELKNLIVPTKRVCVHRKGPHGFQGCLARIDYILSYSPALSDLTRIETQVMFLDVLKISTRAVISGTALPFVFNDAAGESAAGFDDGGVIHSRIQRGRGRGGCAGRKGAKAGSDRFERTTETWLTGLKTELFLPGPTVEARQMFFFGQDLSWDLVCPQLIPQP